MSWLLCTYAVYSVVCKLSCNDFHREAIEGDVSPQALEECRSWWQVMLLALATFECGIGRREVFEGSFRHKDMRGTIPCKLTSRDRRRSKVGLQLSGNRCWATGRLRTRMAITTDATFLEAAQTPCAACPGPTPPDGKQARLEKF